MILATDEDAKVKDAVAERFSLSTAESTGCRGAAASSSTYQ